MKPRRTVLSNSVFRLVGGNEDNDLWVQKVLLNEEGLQTFVTGSPAIRSTWVPTDEERQQIADGANIELQTIGSGTPPLSMVVVDTPLGKPPEELLEAPW